MIKLLLVDDHNSVVKILETFFQNVSDISLIGSADNGKDAIKIIDKCHPDVVIMGVEMPIMNGIEATKIISERFSQTKVLLFASQDDNQVRNLAIKSGATGFISKTTGLNEIDRAVHLIARGFNFFQFGHISSDNIDVRQVLPGVRNTFRGGKITIQSNQNYSATVPQLKPSFYPEIFTRKKPRQRNSGKGNNFPRNLLDWPNLTNNHLFILGCIVGAICCAIIFHYLQN